MSDDEFKPFSRDMGSKPKHIIDFPGGNKNNNTYFFKVDEGSVEIKEGDTTLTIAQALALLERCALEIKKDASWL